MPTFWLSDPDHLAAFRDAYAARTSFPLDPGYLAETQVRGFWSGGQMIGGYVLNTAAPWRYMDQIPEAHHASCAARKYLFGGHSAEVSCMWLDRARVTPRRRVAIYARIFADMLGSGRRYVVAGSLSKGIALLHKQCFRRPVYSGRIDWPGAPYAEIYAVGRGELLVHSSRLLGRGLGDLLFRDQRGRGR